MAAVGEGHHLDGGRLQQQVWGAGPALQLVVEGIGAFVVGTAIGQLVQLPRLAGGGVGEARHRLLQPVVAEHHHGAGIGAVQPVGLPADQHALLKGRLQLLGSCCRGTPLAWARWVRLAWLPRPARH